MTKRHNTVHRIHVMAIIFSCLLSLQVYAHDYTNLNEIMIDRSNEAIINSVTQIQSFLTEIFRQSYKIESWPDRKITLLRNDLMHQKEEANMSLDYFVSQGINIQSIDVLFDKPLAGRSLAANQAVETAFALLKYMDTLESQEEFVKEIYAGGQSAYMYNLVTAYREKMTLYKSIFDSMPGPGQQIITNEIPVPEIEPNESRDQNLVMIFIVIGAILGVLVTGYVRRKKQLPVDNSTDK